jgi:hypothetical protein
VLVFILSVKVGEPSWVRGSVPAGIAVAGTGLAVGILVGLGSGVGLGSAVAVGSRVGDGVGMVGVGGSVATGVVISNGVGCAAKVWATIVATRSNVGDGAGAGADEHAPKRMLASRISMARKVDFLNKRWFILLPF